MKIGTGAFCFWLAPAGEHKTFFEIYNRSRLNDSVAVTGFLLVVR
jgi:hypothetical protein